MGGLLPTEPPWAGLTHASFANTALPPTGFGLFSPEVTYEDLSTLFHGVSERVDLESLPLTTDAWLQLCGDFLA